MNVVFILLMLAVFDLCATYYLLFLSKEKLKLKKWYMAEHNSIIRWCVRKFGLHKGFRLAYVIVFFMLVGFLLYLKNISQIPFYESVWFLCGAYALMNIIHISSIKQLREEVEKKQSKIKITY